MNDDNEIYDHYLFGIGKGGIKAVSYIEKNWNNIHCDSIKYVISDTDEVILNQSSIKNKVLLSNKYKLLDIDKEKLIEHTTNRTLIYLFAGAGGDIGEYLLYDICMTFQKSSPFTINFLSIPFDFEGHEKIENAKQIATKITNECGRVVTIDSQQILLSKPDLYLSDCFSELHNVQYQLFWNSVRCFPAYGYICIDLSDLLYIPYSSKKLCIGFGGANGKNCVEKAFRDARKFFFFYNKRLNDYAKHTRKFNHEQTVRFRDTLARAKDPEKTFFEDLPEALGYDKEALQNPDKVQEFCYVINRAVKELRSCYSDMIDRVEGCLLETLGIESYDYSEYVVEIRKRLAHVKEYLLTDRLKEFYQHVMAEFDNRNEWYQSICYTALEQPLERLRDEQEEKLIDSLLMLFHECEKYSDISKVAEDESDEIYSLDLVSTKGSNIHSQTFRLPESEMQNAEELEKSIDKLLDGFGNDNVSICTLLKILNKKLG
jgi:hypothetical protein